MSRFSKWCDRRLLGRWTKNKLLSRKWQLASVSLIVVVALDASGIQLQTETLRVLEIVIPAYLAVEGALDWRHMRQQQTDEEGDDEP